MTRAASVIHSTWVSHFATAQGAMQIKSMQMISMQMSCMQTSRSLPSGIFHRVFFGLYGFFFQLFSFLFFSSFFGRPPRQKKRKKYKKKKSFQNEIQLNGLDSGRDLERSSGLGTKISNNKKKPRNQSKESRHAQFLIGIQGKKQKIRCPFRWFFFVQRNGRYCKKIR